MILLHALRVLPPAYEPIRAQILGGSSLPTKSKAFFHVMHSTSHSSGSSLVPPPSALVTQAPAYGVGRGRSSRDRG